MLSFIDRFLNFNFFVEKKLILNRKKILFNKYFILILFKFINNYKIKFKNSTRIKGNKIKFFFPLDKKNFKDFKFYIKYNLEYIDLLYFIEKYNKNIVLYKMSTNIYKFNENVYQHSKINKCFFNFFLLDELKIQFLFFINLKLIQNN